MLISSVVTSYMTMISDYDGPRQVIGEGSAFYFLS